MALSYKKKYTYKNTNLHQEYVHFGSLFSVTEFYLQQRFFDRFAQGECSKRRQMLSLWIPVEHLKTGK